jgi:translation initiation factor IF-2
MRNQEEVVQSQMSSLRHLKENVHEIKSGQDCGIGLEDFEDFKVGDILQSITKKQVPRKLGDPK